MPLELQRRIINDVFGSHRIGELVRLAGMYVAIALFGGAAKLALNIYRSWVGERAVQRLRASILDDLSDLARERHPTREGIKVALIVDEVDPIGGFVGTCFSEPVLQGGILVSVLAYMIHLNPLLALATMLVLSPQLVFVPLMQKAINDRVSRRIGVLRQISAVIIGETGPAPAAANGQGARIETVFRLNMGIYTLKFSMNFLMNLAHHLGICTVLAFGGYLVIQGRAEAGTVVAFLSGIGQLNDPWGDLVNWFRDLQVTRTKYDQIARAVATLRTEPTAALDRLLGGQV